MRDPKLATEASFVKYKRVFSLLKVVHGESES